MVYLAKLSVLNNKVLEQQLSTGTNDINDIRLDALGMVSVAQALWKAGVNLANLSSKNYFYVFSDTI